MPVSIRPPNKIKKWEVEEAKRLTGNTEGIIDLPEPEAPKIEEPVEPFEVEEPQEVSTVDLFENQQLAEQAANFAIARGVSPSAKWIWRMLGGDVQQIKLDSGWTWSNSGTEDTADDVFVSPEGLEYSFPEFSEIAKESDDLQLIEDYAGITGTGETADQRASNIISGLDYLFPDMDVYEAYNYYFGDEDRTDEFISKVHEYGRSDEMTSLLSGLGLSDEEIGQIFSYYLASYKDLLDKALPEWAGIGEGGNWLIEYLGDDWEEGLRRSLIGKGRNKDTEALVKAIYGDVPEDQMAGYFSNRALAIEKKAAEGGHGVFGTFTAGVGDLVQSIGGALKWLGAEGVGETLTDAGTYMQVQAEPIPDDLKEFDWGDLFSPQFYLTYGVRMLPTVMALVIPGLGAYGLAGKLGVTARLATLGGRIGLGTFGSKVLAGMGIGAMGSILQSPLESAMEAGSVYDQVIARGGTDEEASQAASETFWKNMATLGISNAAELAVAFMPLGSWGKSASKAIGNGWVKVAQVAGKLVFTGLSEGGEEVYQEIIQKQALGEDIGNILKDPNYQLVFALGAIAGVGMGGGADIITRIQNKTAEGLSADQAIEFYNLKGKYLARGMKDNVATHQALGDMIEKYPEIGEAVEKNTKIVEKEVEFEQVKTTETERFEQAKQNAIEEIEETYQVREEIPTVQRDISETWDFVGLPAQEALSERAGISSTAVGAKFSDLTSVQQDNLRAVHAEVRGVKSMDARIAEVEELLSVKGKPKEGTKSGLRLELARLKAQKEVAENPGDIESNKTDIENEIQARMAPYHAGMKSVSWLKEYDTKQLNEMWGVYDKASKEAGIGPGTPHWTEFFKTPEKAHDWIKKQLTSYIRGNVPLSERGKLLIQVRDAKTMEDLDSAIQKANRISRDYHTKLLKEQIKKELSKIKPKKISGVKKGKFTAETQSILDNLKSNLQFNETQKEAAGARDNIRQKIQQLVEDYQQGKPNPETGMTWTQGEMLKEIESLQMSHINGMTSNELLDVLDFVKSVKSIGRSEQAAKVEERTKVNEERYKTAINSATSGKGLKPGYEALPQSQLEPYQGTLGKLRKMVGSNLDKLNQSWGEMLDIISKYDKTSGQDESIFSQLGNGINKARNQEFEKNQEFKNKSVVAFKRIYGLKHDGEVNSLLNEQGDKEILIGKFKTNGRRKVNSKGEVEQITKPSEVELKLTKSQSMYIYCLLRDPASADAFDIGMGWTQEMKDAVANTLTEQDKAYCDWAQFELLPEMFPDIDAVFSELFFVHLTENPNYMMIRRERDADIPEVMNIYEDMSRYGSVLNPSLKSRVRNALPVKFLDLHTSLYRHAMQMNHFISHAFFIRDLRAVFGNAEVRQAIIQYHGRDKLDIIDSYINSMARGGQDKAQAVKGLDILRKNATLALLARASVPIKQITAWPGYMVEMPLGDFIEGTIDFLRNPVYAFKTLKEKSTGFEARYTAGAYERDIALWSRGNIGRLYTNKIGVREKFLTPIEIMDKFGVIPGQWAKYKSSIKQLSNKHPDWTQSQIEEEAMLEAERSTDRTQNTSYLDTLSVVQNGGTFGKLFTMFQNQTGKYYRLISKNYRNMRAGRISKPNAIFNMFVIWAFIPALFQFMSDAFRWRWEKQLRSWVLGPLNFMLIFSELAKALYDKATGENWDFDASPVLEIFDDMVDIVGDCVDLVQKGSNPYKDITGEDIISFLESVALVGGEFAGLPTPYMVQIEKAIRAGDPRQIIFSQWMLRPLDKSDTEKAIDYSDNLGMSELDIALASEDYRIRKEAEDELIQRNRDIEAGLSVSDLDIYGINDLRSDLARLYNDILPQDVASNGDTPTLAKSWAEQEVLWGDVGILPDKPLYELFENEADLDLHYKDWQVRQTITSLAELEGFDKSRLDGNIHYGNLTRKQYELLKSYFNSTDQDAFLERHPELKEDLRDKYLKENPGNNALLALWGRADILTEKAYKAYQKLIKEYNIPSDALLDTGLPPDEAVDEWFDYLDKMAEFGKSASSAKSSLHFSLSTLDEDNIDLFLLDMEYSLIRDKDGDANTSVPKAQRKAFRESHRDYNQYGIDQGWWKALN
jgi:hypothetical protein